MTINYRTTLSQREGVLNHIDLDDATSCAETQLFRVDSSLAGAITVEANGGIPQGTLFGSIVGPTRAKQASKDVVLNLESSHPVGVTIEESANGTTWPDRTYANQNDFSANAGEKVAMRFVPSAAYWRLRLCTDPGQSVAKVYASSQVRDSGV